MIEGRMAKLLIAEDNEQVGELYREEFEAEGYEVEVVRDGATALARLRESEPDVLVLDIGMPGMSGLDVLAELGAAAGRAPVIVNTAYPMFKLDYRAHRAAAWVTKSSNLAQLKAVVRKALEAAGGEGGKTKI